MEDAESLQSQTLPKLKNLIEKEQLLFSREIEDMYDIKQSEVSSYLQEQLSSDEYQLREVLGEVYIEKQKTIVHKGE